MRQKINITLAFLFSALSLFAQIDLKKGLKTVKDISGSDLGQLSKDALLAKMADSRKDCDQASFNYAVALSDNAGLFESEERGAKVQKIFLELNNAKNQQQKTAQEKASTQNDMGEMMYSANRFGSAQKHFKNARALYESTGDTSSVGYSMVISNMGLLYHTTGRLDSSEYFTQKALNLRKIAPGEASAVYASSLNNLSVLYKDMGRYNEAEQLINQAISINQATVGKESVAYALTLNNQAMLYYAEGRTQQAEALLKEALSIADKTLKDKSTNYVRLLTNLALMYQDQKRYDEANDIYAKAIKIKEEKLSTTHPDYAHLLNNQASLFMQMGKYDKVEENLKKAADIYKKKFGEKHPSYASTISNLGNYYRVSERNGEAEELLKSALDIRREVLGENHPEYVTSMESLGLLYWKMGRQAEATSQLRAVANKNMEHISLYFAPLSEAEKAKFWDKMQPRFQRFFAFAGEYGNADPSLLTDMYNYQLATKGILLNSTNRIKQEIMRGTDKDLKAKYLRWLDQKENLSHLYSLSKDELKDENINLDSLERTTNALEKELAAKSNVFKQGYTINNLKLKDIQSLLGMEDALVEIIRFHKFDKITTDSVYYACLLLTKETPAAPKLMLLRNGNKLEKQYYAYYKNCVKQKLEDKASYNQFWKPIHESLGAKKNIYLCPDGVYNQVNINTFKMADGLFVLDKKDIILITHSKEVKDLKAMVAARAVENSAILMGFPNYGNKGTVSPLPGTKKELDNSKLSLSASGYKVNYFVQNDASEEKLKSLKSAKILHIATHGFFLPEPENDGGDKVFGIESSKAKANPMLRAGLMLAGAENAMDGTTENGILTAYEVMNLSLDNTEIVLMSACETGLGDVKNGEGVYGLQRGFQVAGAKSLIMSLWKVNDDATQKLINSFYKNYLLTKNKHKAFKTAQMELKTTFKDPYFWGAFILVE